MKTKRQFVSSIIVIFVAVIAAGFGLIARAQVANGIFPSVPAGVSATIVPPAQVTVSWGSSSESSGTIEDYRVYRNGLLITTTAGTSFTDTGLPSGVYAYAVAAVDTNGNASVISPSTSVTLLADTVSPSMPTGIIITGSTSTNRYDASTTLTISWGASTDNVGVAGYYVYRNGTPLTVGTSTAITGTSVTDVVTLGIYSYTVTAYDASQNISSRSTPVTVAVTLDSIPPTIPKNVLAAQVSAGGVNLFWATSTDPAQGSEPTSGVAGYQIFRNGLQVASAGGSPYADSGLGVGIDYTYAVAAYDSVGNVSPQSAPATVTLQVPNGPTVPTGLSSMLIGTSTVRLSWNSAGDILVVTGYAVYRDGTQIASPTSTSYLDKGLAPGTYAYNVSAGDSGGFVSATSSILSVVVSVPGSAIAVTSPTIVPPSTPSASLLAASGTSSMLAVTGAATFTQFLYFGLRGAQVKSLQSLLAEQGYLASANATGFFGNLTLSALQKFQCDQNIVCTGGAGWGMVGPKTRNALNALEGGVSITASSTSISALNAELQALKAKLAALEQQAQ